MLKELKRKLRIPIWMGFGATAYEIQIARLCIRINYWPYRYRWRHGKLRSIPPFCLLSFKLQDRNDWDFSRRLWLKQCVCTRVCDCQDYERGFVSNECPHHNDTPYPSELCEAESHWWQTTA